MSRAPGDRAINHGGIGWVDPAPGAPADDLERRRIIRDINKLAALVSTADAQPDVFIPGVPRWPWEHHDLGEWTAETVAPHRAAGCELTAPCKLAGAAPPDKR